MRWDQPRQPNEPGPRPRGPRPAQPGEVQGPQLVTKATPAEEAFVDLAGRFYRLKKRSAVKALLERTMNEEVDRAEG